MRMMSCGIARAVGYYYITRDRTMPGVGPGACGLLGSDLPFGVQLDHIGRAGVDHSHARRAGLVTGGAAPRAPCRVGRERKVFHVVCHCGGGLAIGGENAERRVGVPKEVEQGVGGGGLPGAGRAGELQHVRIDEGAWRPAEAD
jgi:hypothetical protein